MGRLIKEADTLIMTYFNNINHQYNRVIFEFTDEEKQEAGFHKTSKEPAILEILQLLHRIADDQIINGDKVSPAVLEKAKKAVAELQTDMINSFSSNESEKSKEADLSETQEIMKRLDEDEKESDKKDIPSPLLSIELFSNGDSNFSMGSSDIKYVDLQRKKDGWKAKALRLIDFLNNKDKRVKRLKDALKKYGEHTIDCDIEIDGIASNECTCGFKQTLKEK